jgi:D-glycero-alpha-D-manno-heptose-7-phosphate kinase
MLFARAPYRLSLFGGGTDYPEYFKDNKCLVLSVAINKHCYISLRNLPPYFNTHKSRFVWSKIELVSELSEISHVGARNILEYFQVDDDLELHHFGDLPSRSGIGSSSAFTVALITAITKHKKISLSGFDLAKTAIHIEKNMNNENVGIQDQITSSLGGLLRIDAYNDEINAQAVLAPKDYLSKLEDSILLGFYGNPRSAEYFSAKATQGIKSGRDISALRNINQIAEEALASIQAECEIEVLGKLIDETWRLKLELSSRDASLDDICLMFETAKKCGAYGGKLMGAGGSGFFYLLAPPETHDIIKSCLSTVKVWLGISFDYVGAAVQDSVENWQRA